MPRAAAAVLDLVDNVNRPGLLTHMIRRFVFMSSSVVFCHTAVATAGFTGTPSHENPGSVIAVAYGCLESEWLMHAEGRAAWICVRRKSAEMALLCSLIFASQFCLKLTSTERLATDGCGG